MGGQMPGMGSGALNSMLDAAGQNGLTGDDSDWRFMFLMSTLQIKMVTSPTEVMTWATKMITPDQAGALAMLLPKGGSGLIALILSKLAKHVTADITNIAGDVMDSYGELATAGSSFEYRDADVNEFNNLKAIMSTNYTKMTNDILGIG